MTERATSRRLERVILASIALVVVGSVALGFGVSASGPGAREFTDLAGAPVIAEIADTPSAGEWQQMDVEERVGSRMAIPSVGLDVPLGAVNAVNGSVTPGGFDAAYLVRNRGVPLGSAETGTVYVVMHSARFAAAPGNLVIDPASGVSTVAVGDTITIGGRQYVADAAWSVARSRLPREQQVWTDAPGRLVIITCMQNAQATPATENAIVTARLVDS